jgi:alanyl-tRNA synthetase
MSTVAQIRKSFLDYFKGKAHLVLPSSPLIPPEDPTLLFTNAGMVQFKEMFLGKKKSPSPAIATCQKCLRISGKHNDFDEVGFTHRHLTFFEMLGNFSFGAYFKEEAIAYAWEFLTQVCNLPKDKLFATVHVSDDEAYTLWHQKIGLPEARIFRLKEDNFWQMADTGPCGPCTEVHVDLGETCGPLGGDNVVGGAGPRFVEVWNLVFMQYERKPDGSESRLPTPCVDTGMGLERLAAVMQGVLSNFEINDFVRLRQWFEQETGVNFSERNRVNFRVACDHVRSTLFLMAEGVFPSNEGRGYVLRRVVRRALRFLGQLGESEHIEHAFSSVLPKVAELYETVPDYQGLFKDVDRYAAQIREEESRFFKVVRRGSVYLDQTIEELKQKNKSLIPGDVAFKLHDTYGFPIDLTRLIAKQHHLQVDEVDFEAALQKQREVSRQTAANNQAGSAFLRSAREHSDWFEGVPPTRFVGYQTLRAQVRALKVIPSPEGLPLILLVTDETPFYATGGGQIGDRGKVRSVDGEGVGEVLTCEKGFGEGVFVHLVQVSGPIKANQDLVLEVDTEHRLSTVANHTATHLLHAALRKVLGVHVRQMGSYVGPEELRFDFSHGQKMTDEEKRAVEHWVNEQIQLGWPVTAREIPLDQARKEGTLMFFDEKYGEQVRQLRIEGPEFPVSLELCGGTHVSNTREILAFKIMSEQSIAQGVRRIVAKAGKSFVDYSFSLAGELSAKDRLAEEIRTQERKKNLTLIQALAREWRGARRRARGDCAVFDLPMALDKKELSSLLDPLFDQEHVTNVFLRYGEGAERLFLLRGSLEKYVESSVHRLKERFPDLRMGGKGKQYQGKISGNISLRDLQTLLGDDQLKQGDS